MVDAFRQYLKDIGDFIRVVGFPVLAFCALLWMMEKHWLGPSSKRIDIMTEAINSIVNELETDAKDNAEIKETLRRIEENIKR